jgi:hypothetical protein
MTGLNGRRLRPPPQGSGGRVDRRSPPTGEPRGRANARCDRGNRKIDGDKRIRPACGGRGRAPIACGSAVARLAVPPRVRGLRAFGRTVVAAHCGAMWAGVVAAPYVPYVLVADREVDGCRGLILIVSSSPLSLLRKTVFGKLGV